MSVASSEDASPTQAGPSANWEITPGAHWGPGTANASGRRLTMRDIAIPVAPGSLNLRVDRQPERAAELRRIIADHFAGCPVEAIEGGQLLVTELFTEALGQAQGTIDFSATRTDRALQFQMAYDVSHPTPLSVPSPSSRLTLGLLLIQQIPSAWTVRWTANGTRKTARFHLPL